MHRSPSTRSTSSHPAIRPRLPISRRGLGALALTSLLPLTACSSPRAAVPGNGDGGGATSLADADVLTDPAAFEGPSTARLAGAEIRPVSSSPSPTLPVTVTDAQGTKVEVTDVSRILALDLYGSTSRIVFDLGLGGNVVGRDVSSGFDEIADKPLVTQNGHELNAGSILSLNPSVILTDTSLGPWDVILQMRDAGIPVVVLDSHRPIDGTPALIRQVATALGLPEDGKKLAARTVSPRSPTSPA